MRGIFLKDRLLLSSLAVRSEVIFTGVIMILWLWLFIRMAFPDLHGVDFYPLYIGATELIAGRNPYGEETQFALKNIWATGKIFDVAHVVAYPAPFLLAISPLVFLPLHVAVIVWTALCIVSVLIPISLISEQRRRYLLPFLYYPLFHALCLKNASVLILGIGILLVTRYFKINPLLKGFLCTLCLCKPQAGIFYALYSNISERKWVNGFWTIASLGMLILIAFILYPEWVTEWLKAVKIYSNEATISNLFPWNILLCLVVLQAPPVIAISLLQALIFPINDLYASLPLLLGWYSFRPLVSLLGVSFSLLIPIVYEAPNSSEAFLLFCIFPYIMACLLSQLGRLERYSMLTMWRIDRK